MGLIQLEYLPNHSQEVRLRPRSQRRPNPAPGVVLSTRQMPTIAHTAAAAGGLPRSLLRVRSQRSSRVHLLCQRRAPPHARICPRLRLKRQPHLRDRQLRLRCQQRRLRRQPSPRPSRARRARRVPVSQVQVRPKKATTWCSYEGKSPPTGMVLHGTRISWKSRIFE